MMRLPLYQRYLMRETFASVLLVLVAFLALFSFFDLINEARNVGKGGYQFGHALIFVTLSVPGRIYELVPIAALIGTLYALSTLARHSEITVPAGFRSGYPGVALYPVQGSRGVGPADLRHRGRRGSLLGAGRPGVAGQGHG